MEEKVNQDHEDKKSNRIYWLCPSAGKFYYFDDKVRTFEFSECDNPDSWSVDLDEI